MPQQLRNQRLPKPLDIHHPPRSKVPQLFLQPRRAAHIHAPQINLTHLPHQPLTTPRTNHRKHDLFRPTRMRCIFNDLGNLRNHIPAALHRNIVPNPHTQPHNLIRIMQRSPRNRSPTYQHRSQRGHRRHLPGPSHLEQHTLQLRHRRSRRKLISNRPSRSLPRKP